MNGNVVQRIALTQLRIPVLRGFAVMNDSDERPGHSRYFFDSLISGLGRRIS
jgi:hypothetical protein